VWPRRDVSWSGNGLSSSIEEPALPDHQVDLARVGDPLRGPTRDGRVIEAAGAAGQVAVPKLPVGTFLSRLMGQIIFLLDRVYGRSTMIVEVRSY
jgi:hypothetical protein